MILNIDTLVSIAGAVLGFSGLISGLFAIRAARAWRMRCLMTESSLVAVHRELELMASISVKTGRRLKRIEREYAGVADRIAQLELRGAAPSFDQAIDSARRGADPGKLTRQFGLSCGEADLVARLHGRKKSA